MQIRERIFCGSYSKCPDYWVRFMQSCTGQCTGRCLQYGLTGCPHFKGKFIQVEYIRPIVGNLEIVHIIEVSAFQGCLQGGVPLYSE